MTARTRNLFDPTSQKPYKLSRSRLENFLKCARCFYIDRRLGVDHVSGPPFTLNTATDTLLKKEFDVHRADGTRHPLMKKYKIDAVPFQHEHIDEWRENFKGVRYLHAKTNLIITGAVDDIWVNPKGELIVVDYKSTSKNGEVTLDDEWKDGYKRQMEMYQWLLRRLGFTVHKTGYFVYVNADTSLEAFDGKLVFEETLLPYKGNDEWVEKTVIAAKKCLMGKTLPKGDKDCEWCNYRKHAAEVLA